MKNFQIELNFDVPAGELYKAVIHADKWWTKNVAIKEGVGEQMNFRFIDVGFHAQVEITDMTPNKKIRWEVIDSKHSEESGFSDLTSWVGTALQFELEEESPGETKLKFTHEGLAPRLECYDICAKTWKFYLDESLRDYVKKGMGQPYLN